MLEIFNENCALEVKETETGLRIKFIITYDTDYDDTISYTLKNIESLKKLRDTYSATKMARIITDDRNVELVFGVALTDIPEIFFSIGDYASDEAEKDTKKVYSISVSKETENYDMLYGLLSLIREDIKLKEEKEKDEYKSDNAKHKR